MTLKTSMFYAYQDQYGWAVAIVPNAPYAAFPAVYGGPRTFGTRAQAEVFIKSICQ